MIDLHALKAGSQVGFKVTMGHEILYSTGTITAIEKNRVRIDELILSKQDLLPILLTSDTLLRFGCLQISTIQWRSPSGNTFEFDGIKASFNNGSAPTCYLHMLQYGLFLTGKELQINEA